MRDGDRHGLIRRHGLSRLGVLLGLAILLPALAPAQTFRDGLIANGPDPLARRVMRDYGLCVAQNLGREVQTLLSLEPGTDAYGRAARRLSDYSGHCVPDSGRLQMRGIVFVGSLAEGALMRGKANAGWEQRVAFDPAKPAYRARNELDGVAACTVMYAPAETKGLFATSPATPEENAAFAALTPTIQKCVREGMTAKLDRVMLRALLGLTAYRIANNIPNPVRS